MYLKEFVLAATLTICLSIDLQEVDFSTIGGTARATSNFNDLHSATQGFGPPHGFPWQTECCTTPQSIWYEFPQDMRVTKFSFQCRTDDWADQCPSNGPSRYVFWGSNSNNCDNSETRMTLVEDNSGTPFNAEGLTKTMHVENSRGFRCYGFTINAVPTGYHAAMSNIRFFYPKG